MEAQRLNERLREIKRELDAFIELNAKHKQRLLLLRLSGKLYRLVCSTCPHEDLVMVSDGTKCCHDCGQLWDEKGKKVKE